MCHSALQERYVNFYTDFAFKKLFGTEANKDLLISFLNSLFDGTEVIVTDFDKWLYAIKNLATLMERPAALQDAIFQRFFEQAEIAKFNSNDLRSYRESQKDFWDMCAVTETAEKKGRAEGLTEGMEKGRAEGKAELIKTMHANGMTAEAIAAAIGFDLAEVEEILNHQALS